MGHGLFGRQRDCWAPEIRRLLEIQVCSRLSSGRLATMCSATGAKTPVVLLLYESFSVGLSQYFPMPPKIVA